MDKESTLREIEAGIRRLMRRTGRESGGENGVDRWVLNGADWLLTAPNRHTIKLTATEFAFLNLLCGRSGEVCARDELIAIAARPRSHFDARHLDAVVSRRRRKRERRTNLSTPTQRGFGVGLTFNHGR